MQRYVFPIILLIGMLGCLASGIAQADEQLPRREQPTWRLEMATPRPFRNAVIRSVVTWP